MLESELSRKRRLPTWVSFSTASDAFQDIDEVLETSFQAMRLLLERGIGVSFLTKGYIPSEFISLFNKYRNRVKARIGIVSLSDDYWRLFEPGTAHPFKRLLNIRNLMGAGIEVSVRIDPIIPSVSGSFESLIKRLKILDVRNITISHLIMRPSIMSQMFIELPLPVAKKIIRLYQGQPLQRVITSAKTRLLSKEIRLKELDEVKSISKRYGIECRYCGCKNPDLPREFCGPWVELGLPEVKSTQMTLFM
jgi:DNA repair photolyase